ncbi:MAG: hypothetical protein FWG05_06040, partial [Kiritimatiellaeota bacterium]|nr:hypothetical protein [Kiritimatiellota bacterium]
KLSTLNSQFSTKDFSCASTIVAGLDDCICSGGPVVRQAAHSAAATHHQRILTRVQKMYADGLLDEAARLRRAYPEFSRTAGKGIGYAEALAVLDGAMSVNEAIEKTALRTRQLAKRQRTWFRRQLTVKWVQSPLTSSDISRAADEVAAIWKEHGSVRIFTNNGMNGNNGN